LVVALERLSVGLSRSSLHALVARWANRREQSLRRRPSVDRRGRSFIGTFLNPASLVWPRRIATQS